MDAHMLSIIHEDDRLPQRMEPTYGRELGGGAPSPPHAVSGYLFGGDRPRRRRPPPGILGGHSSIRLVGETRFLTLAGTKLIVSPFRITRFGLTYFNATEMRIQLRELRPGRFRVLAVHNFRIEDRSPDLGECIAGVFLARWNGRAWEEPERYPIECRSIRLLGEFDIRTPPGGGLS